jgi:hypothetical protein
MGTYGVPSDIFAQQVLHIEQGPSPPLSVSPAGPRASRLIARRAVRRSQGLGGAGRDGLAS